MTTALARAVDALSDPKVGLSDALRMLLVVSHRIGAEKLSIWLRNELDGYEAGDSIPVYREGSNLPIDLRFEGPFGSSAQHTLSPRELPDVLREAVKDQSIYAPVAELVELSQGANDPVWSLPVQWVVLYRELAEKRQAPTYEMMQLNRAAVKIPSTYLKGILDRIKTTGLDLALSLEDISTDVGVVGGPTVADEPRIAQQVNIHLTQLFGDNATLTVGDNATVASAAGAVAVTVGAGDIAGLLEAAKEILSSEGVDELAAALDEDGGEFGRETTKFLDRVKQGGVVLVGGITTNAAYSGLVALLGQAFGG